MGREVMVRVKVEAPLSFGLKLRIPGWCPEFHLKVNGRAELLKPERGYIRIDREWKDGDRVELNLSMPIELIKAHPEVIEDAGCVAMQRGPLVYCLEQIDNLVPPGPGIPLEGRSLADRIALHRIVIPKGAKFTESFEAELLDGVVVVSGDAEYDSGWDAHAVTPVPASAQELYRRVRGERRPFKIKAIPYFAWQNRTLGEMRVWIRADS